MLHISNNVSLIGNQEYINQFRDLYESAFPDPDEREDFERILDRVKGIRSIHDPNTFLILNIVNNRVVAGQIADWYQESKCIHLTYLVVEPEYRQHGIARRILKEEIPKMIKEIKKQNKVEIEALFFESNNPSLEKTVKMTTYFQSKLTTHCRSKLTTCCQFKMTSGCRSKVTT